MLVDSFFPVYNMSSVNVICECYLKFCFFLSSNWTKYNSSTIWNISRNSHSILISGKTFSISWLNVCMLCGFFVGTVNHIRDIYLNSSFPKNYMIRNGYWIISKDFPVIIHMIWLSSIIMLILDNYLMIYIFFTTRPNFYSWPLSVCDIYIISVYMYTYKYFLYIYHWRWYIYIPHIILYVMYIYRHIYIHISHMYIWYMCCGYNSTCMYHIYNLILYMYYTHIPIWYPIITDDVNKF